MLAAFSLGAEGVQIGTRFVTSVESSAHENFKNKILESKDGDTHLILKRLVPVRLIKNKFFEEVEKLEITGAPLDVLSSLLGRGRAKKGMFDGNLDEGELEIGQISGLLKEIKPAAEIVQEIIFEYNKALKELKSC